jgi:hypothetical protein
LFFCKKIIKNALEALTERSEDSNPWTFKCFEEFEIWILIMFMPFAAHSYCKAVLKNGTKCLKNNTVYAIIEK